MRFMRWMKCSAATACVLTFSAGAAANASANADVKAAAGPIVKVGLFKNGLAVVTRKINLPAPGWYRLEDLPEPVHGTWWVHSAGPLATRVTTIEVEEPLNALGLGDPQTDLAGRRVTLRFRDAAEHEVRGTVVKLPKPDERTWNRVYEPANPYAWNRWHGGSSNEPSRAWNARHLVIDTEKGRLFVDPATVTSLTVEDAASQPMTVKRRKTILMIGSAEKDGPAREALVTYVTKGMAWAPAYRIELAADGKLHLTQQATIKNELSELKDVEIELITGFPSIQFSHVTSIMSPNTNLALFFAALQERPWLSGSSTGNVMVQRVMENRGAPAGGGTDGVDFSAPAGEGVDLHYESIGRWSLDEGDSLTLPVKTATTDFERIVEWVIPDPRDGRGHMVSTYERERDPERFDESAWDAVRFRNPLGMPMTTAAAMIVDGGRFAGQRIAMFANENELATLRITKSLSVKTAHREAEIAEEREVVNVAGRTLQRTAVKGELVVENGRSTPLTVIVKRRFSGELLDQPEGAENTLLADGIWSINRRNELTWTVTLQPGEEKALTFQYRVLVER